MSNERRNLILKAKERTAFRLIQGLHFSNDELTCTTAALCEAEKDTIFLVNASEDIPFEKFDILDEVEMVDKKRCPCCADDVKYFKIDTNKYPGVVHVFDLMIKREEFWPNPPKDLPILSRV